MRAGQGRRRRRLAGLDFGFAGGGRKGAAEGRSADGGGGGTCRVMPPSAASAGVRSATLMPAVSNGAASYLPERTASAPGAAGMRGGGGGAAPGAVEADEDGRAHVAEELRVEGGAEAAPAAGAAVVGPVRALGEVAGGRGEEEDAARDDD